MTNKKILLTIIFALSISLCLPICAKMTWQERVVHGANYGFWGALYAYFIHKSDIFVAEGEKLWKDDQGDFKYKYVKTMHREERQNIRLTAILGEGAVDQLVISYFFPDSDRSRSRLEIMVPLCAVIAASFIGNELGKMLAKNIGKKKGSSGELWCRCLMAGGLPIVVGTIKDYLIENKDDPFEKLRKKTRKKRDARKAAKLQKQTSHNAPAKQGA